MEGCHSLVRIALEENKSLDEKMKKLSRPFAVEEEGPILKINV